MFSLFHCYLWFLSLICCISVFLRTSAPFMTVCPCSVYCIEVHATRYNHSFIRDIRYWPDLKFNIWLIPFYGISKAGYQIQYPARYPSYRLSKDGF